MSFRWGLSEEVGPRRVSLKAGLPQETHETGLSVPDGGVEHKLK